MFRILSSLLCSCLLLTANAATLADSRQLILVVSDNWDSSTAALYSFERQQQQWQAVGIDSQVTLGKNGSAWGIGIHQPQAGLQKAEGDGRAPAGIFALRQAFGYLPRQLRLPYLQMTAGHYCVDVPQSAHYNQIIDTSITGEAAAEGSTEPMRRDLHVNGDQLYKLGVVVEDNPNNVSGAGSCIFMHLWRSPSSATAGCTAMPEGKLDALLQWLDPEKQPVMVLLPRDEYQRLQAQWQLPELVN